MYHECSFNINRRRQRALFLSKMLIHLCMIICGRKHFCHCLQAFGRVEILKRQIKDCFKINGKQRIQMPKKRE